MVRHNRINGNVYIIFVLVSKLLLQLLIAKRQNTYINNQPPLKLPTKTY